MDSDKRSAQVERLEVVETGRRRRWSEDEKLKIVLESLQASRQVAATARRYGISRSLLLRWRRSFRPEPKDAPAQQMGFVPAMVVPESGTTPGPVGSAGGGAIEIEFAAGARMRITGAVDAATLTAAVAALADGRPR
jgi:transposase